MKVGFFLMLFFFIQFAVCLYRDLMKAGKGLGVRNAGRSAVDCLRIERVIPQMGSELTSFITPWEAGIKDSVQLNKVWCKHYQLGAVTSFRGDGDVTTKVEWLGG